MELYARVRRAVLVEGKSRRAVSREFGLARKTIGKMLEYSVPPGYQRQKPVLRPKLGPWLGVIDAILEDDKQRPHKQRHTAKRIFDRLRAEYAFTGGYTIIKDYVRSSKIGGQEMFVPLSHARARRGAGRLRRSACGDRRGRAEGALHGLRSASLGRLLCASFSGRDD